MIFFVFPAFSQEREKDVKEAVEQVKPSTKKNIKEKVELGQKEQEVAKLNKDERGIQVGDEAPKFNIEGKSGNKYSLEEYLSNGPLVIVFYRGEWCKYCNKYISDLVDSYPAIKDFGAEIIAVTPELDSYTLAMRKKTKAEFPIIADQGNELMKMYDVDFELDLKTRKRYDVWGINLDRNNGKGNYTLPIPATYVIDKNGIVTYRHFDENYKERADVNDVLKALKATTK